VQTLGTILVGMLAFIGALALLAGALLWWKVGRHFREHKAKSDREQNFREEADWFGTTGLDEETERELPRYLRREFGESLFDEDSLKAASLQYVGAFAENGGTTHYWKIPYGKDERVFAYIDVENDGNTCTGWGGREPPAT
jgi:hypothetical protein